MDNIGARVENEAVIGMLKLALPRHRRSFILNKPFGVIMQREGVNKNPYFILGVNNTSVKKK
jgi:hypothetical protein